MANTENSSPSPGIVYSPLIFCEIEVLYLWDQVLILCLFYSCYISPWRIWFATASEMFCQKQIKPKQKHQICYKFWSFQVFLIWIQRSNIPTNITYLSLENRLPPSVLASPPSLLCSSSFHPSNSHLSLFSSDWTTKALVCPTSRQSLDVNKDVNKETTQAQHPLPTHSLWQRYDLRWLPRRHGYWWAKVQIIPRRDGDSKVTSLIFHTLS